ncbi:MAG: rod shape-determining protein RodA [Bacteroidales bacterium]|nr:rod shape-determining protein RodA [Bacteroidales bacterium]
MKHSVDWRLVVTYLLLILIGWVNIYASIHSEGPASIFDFSFRCGKQFVWILTAVALAALILFVINPGVWQSAAVPIYLFVLVLLVAVIFLGIEVKGSRSWFEFGPVRFQPAEISKISTSLLLASVMSQPGYKITKTKYFLLTALVIGLPMLIILGESETGSALVYAGFIFVMYREGLSGWWIFSILVAILLFILTLTLSPYVSVLVLLGIVALGVIVLGKRLDKWLPINLGVLLLLAFLPRLMGLAAGKWAFLEGVQPLYILLGICLCAAPYFIYKAFVSRNRYLMLSALGVVAGIALVLSTDVIFNSVLQDHQRKRIEVLLGIKEDPAGVGYNVAQSMIAIGSGGLTGKGFLNGTQTTFGFVPEQSTDFIFCTVGEEWGFLGCALVILLYVFLIYRIVADAEKCRESFTRIYGYCVAACIFMHLFINIGMTIGLMPVIGIPLPLLSYGGSSLWAFTVLIFIFISLYRQEKKYY